MTAAAQAGSTVTSVIDASGADALNVTRQQRWRLRASTEAVPVLRIEVKGVMAFWGHDGLTDSVCLCLTELLANVINHAGSPGCVLTLQDVGAGIRLTVSDGSRRLPVVQEPDELAESGRGMQLIAATATAFGSASTASGKDVWAEFRDTA
ncbi:ATP-binding protein [Streptomyces sp. SL13]|uniref:ATP-binding protein n=1 Tax=Streptantibioticus silvisoli TaxID=2705255 RepID=A0AA90H0K6_9ACTN|nr:ATP-binding protein [Streptantibioticus silvisoli]MDI5969906.1 ATP-binding protein [Streptantibioticus silvisoli]